MPDFEPFSKVFPHGLFHLHDIRLIDSTSGWALVQESFERLEPFRRARCFSLDSSDWGVTNPSPKLYQRNEMRFWGSQLEKFREEGRQTRVNSHLLKRQSPVSRARLVSPSKPLLLLQWNIGILLPVPFRWLFEGRGKIEWVGWEAQSMDERTNQESEHREIWIGSWFHSKTYFWIGSFPSKSRRDGG